MTTAQTLKKKYYETIRTTTKRLPPIFNDDAVVYHIGHHINLCRANRHPRRIRIYAFYGRNRDRDACDSGGQQRHGGLAFARTLGA